MLEISCIYLFEKLNFLFIDISILYFNNSNFRLFKYSELQNDYKLMKLMKGNMLFSLKTIKICNKQLDSKPQVVVQRLNLEAWPPHRPLGKIPQFFFLGFLPQEPSPLDRTVKVGNKGIEVYEGFPRVILFNYGILRSLVGIKDTQVYGV